MGCPMCDMRERVEARLCFVAPVGVDQAIDLKKKQEEKKTNNVTITYNNL